MNGTPYLALPYIMASQAQKHLTHNEALRTLDILVHLTVKTRALASPPASPEEDERHIVGENAAGAWQGWSGRIAVRHGDTWEFLDPRRGWQAHVVAEDSFVFYDGQAWRRVPANFPGEVPQLGVGQAADASNRLAVASPASLFNHAGSDHRLKINKAAAGDTASLLLQAGFQGRAELGLAGRNDFALKVSPDGASWREVLWANAASGRIAMPFTALAEDMLVNGSFAVNQRGFAGGALAAGKFGFDRWKAGTGGASVSAASGSVTLSEGSLVQTVEAAIWPEARTTVLTFSVTDLAGGSIEVTCGSASATVAAGPGLRTAVLTPAASGNFSVTIRPTGAAVSFASVALTAGDRRFAPRSRATASETELCRRYFNKSYDSTVAPADGAGGPGYHTGVCYTAGTIASQRVPLAPLMRAAPTLTFHAPNTGNPTSAGKWQAFGPGIAYANATTMALAEVTSAGFTANIAFANAAAGSAYLLCGGWSAQAEL